MKCCGALLSSLSGQPLSVPPRCPILYCLLYRATFARLFVLCVTHWLIFYSLSFSFLQLQRSSQPCFGKLTKSPAANFSAMSLRAVNESCAPHQFTCCQLTGLPLVHSSFRPLQRAGAGSIWATPCSDTAPRSTSTPLLRAGLTFCCA